MEKYSTNNTELIWTWCTERWQLHQVGEIFLDWFYRAGVTLRANYMIKNYDAKTETLVAVVGHLHCKYKTKYLQLQA